MAAVRAAIPLASPLRESPVESLSLAHMALAVLPLPACQVAIATPVGVYFPDFYWEAQNLIGEVDGWVKYEDAAAIVHEKEREQVLRDLGFRIVRWLGKEIHGGPDLVLARIDRALRTGRARRTESAGTDDVDGRSAHAGPEWSRFPT